MAAGFYLRWAAGVSWFSMAMLDKCVYPWFVAGGQLRVIVRGMGKKPSGTAGGRAIVANRDIIELPGQKEESGCMSKTGTRWTVQDRQGNPIYLTEERWQHIVDPTNHPEVVEYESHLQLAIRKGKRRQEPLNPRKYRYIHDFDDLPEDFNQLVVIVLYSFEIDEEGHTLPNNYVATAFMKHV
jgi:hypothetical protein